MIRILLTAGALALHLMIGTSSGVGQTSKGDASSAALSTLYWEGNAGIRREMQDRFEAMDANKDGKVTSEEAGYAGGWLVNQFDSNKDGAISFEELFRPLPPVEITKPTTAPLRDLDPVELTGEAVPSLLGVKPSLIVAFRYGNGWQQIPVQIDERKRGDLVKIRGGTWSPTLPSNFTTLVYCDPKTRVGEDTDPTFDRDDELTFMFKDTGGRAGTDDPKGVVAGTRVEMSVVDPLFPVDRYVYLFLSDGSLTPAAGKKYVSYTFRALKPAGATPLPQEDSEVKTSVYELHYSAIWMNDGLRIKSGGATGVDILQAGEIGKGAEQGHMNSERLSWTRPGDFVAHREGPVRAIRSAAGIKSARLTVCDDIFYEGRTTKRIFWRCHEMGTGLRLFYNLSQETNSMTYRDNLNPDGVLVDGKPDNIQVGPLQWQNISGKQGSLTCAWRFETNIPQIQQITSFYCDSFDPPWAEAGAELPPAFGAQGGVLEPRLNTDMNSPYWLFVERVLYYDSPTTTTEQIRGRAAAGQFPLRVKATRPSDE